MYLILILWTTTLLLRRSGNPSRLHVEDKSHRRVPLALGVLPEENTQGPSRDWMKELEGMKSTIQNLEVKLEAQEVELKTQKVKTKAQEVKLEAQEVELKTQKVETKNLGARLDNFSTVFGEMTNIALLETAVYEFVQAPPSFRTAKEVGKFKYIVASPCSLVLLAFVQNNGLCLYGTGTSKQPPRYKTWIWPGVPKGQGIRRAAMIQGLYGATAYVDAATREDVENFDPSERNQIAHNGAFLDGVYPLKPPNKAGNVKFGTMKAKVEAMRASFESAARTYEPEKGVKQEQALKNAVDKLLAALEKKNISPHTKVTEEVLNFLLQDDFH